MNNIDVQEIEGQLPKKYGSDAVEIPGARAVLDGLTAIHFPWAIVTSGTSPLVNGWLEVLKLQKPDYLISAEDVPNGKPDPSSFSLHLTPCET